MNRVWRMGVGVVLLLAAGAAQSALAGEVRAVLGTAYDSNLYKAAGDVQGGWFSRLYVTSSGYLIRRPNGQVHLQHQGGVKRFWASERKTAGPPGDVLVYNLDARGQVRASRRWTLSSAGTVKLKHASRVPREESYLRGSVEGRATGLLGRWGSGSGYYRRGGDDSRDVSLPEVSLHEVGLGVDYGRSRRLRLHLGFARRRLDYDRPALALYSADSVVELTEKQSDLLREVSANAQVYRGALIHLSYGLLDNLSNSFGYGFRAHRFQVLVTRHIAWEIDGQVYLNLQFRKYDDPLNPLPGAESEADEYEQTMGIFKLSRQFMGRYGVALQYGFHRNGARRSGAFYRKHVFTVSLDASL